MIDQPLLRMRSAKGPLARWLGVTGDEAGSMGESVMYMDTLYEIQVRCRILFVSGIWTHFFAQ